MTQRQIANTAAARSLALVCTYESNYCCNNLGLRCCWLLIRGKHHDTVTVKLKLRHLLPVVDGNGNGNSLVIIPSMLNLMACTHGITAELNIIINCVCFELRLSGWWVYKNALW